MFLKWAPGSGYTLPGRGVPEPRSPKNKPRPIEGWAAARLGQPVRTLSETWPRKATVAGRGAVLTAAKLDISGLSVNGIYARRRQPTTGFNGIRFHRLAQSAIIPAWTM